MKMPHCWKSHVTAHFPNFVAALTLAMLVPTFCSLLIIFANSFGHRSGPEVIKLFSCSTQQSIKIIMLINVKMPTIVGFVLFCLF